MITGKDIYDVFAGIVPLYVAMILAYGSVRWLKIFTPDQCSGINRFVSVIALPLLSFHFISATDPYAMNYSFIAADSLQKVVILVALFLWNTFTKHGSLEWSITLFSLSTQPSTLVMGIPLLKAMYGDFAASLMVQLVAIQSIIWSAVMLFMFEYRGAKLLISEQFPKTAGSITSFPLDSDVVSLNGREPLEADAEIGEDGKLPVVVRRSYSSSMISSFNKSHLTSMTPRSSNLTGVEIYSVPPSREPTPRASSFNQTDFYAMFAGKASSPKHGYTNSFQSNRFSEVHSLQSSKGATPRTSNFEEEILKMHKKSGRSSMSGELFSGGLVSSYPTPNPVISGNTSGGPRKKDGSGSVGCAPNNELHIFVWSSSASPASEGNLRPVVNTAAFTDFGATDPSKAVLQNMSLNPKANGERKLEIEEGTKFPASGSPDTQKKEDMEEGDANKKQQLPPTSVMTRLILIMVWMKLIRNPNTYASVLGLAWSLISYRWHLEMPTIIRGSISILSDAGLGMAMFSLGLFMALQPKIIACGKSMAAFSMAVKFLIGPAVIAACSIAVGLRGRLLHVSIIQAALPVAVVPFVFAKEYNVHPDILSTSVIFGMLVALPVTILYYVLLGL